MYDRAPYCAHRAGTPMWCMHRTRHESGLCPQHRPLRSRPMAPERPIRRKTVAELSTKAVKGMILHHATTRLGWTWDEASAAFDAWFGDCGAHRLFVGQDVTAGEWSRPSEPSCAGCGGDGVQIEDDPESTRQIVRTCDDCGGTGSNDPSP